MPNGGLFRKELRQLLPWTFLILVWVLASLVAWLGFASPDEFVWAPATPLFEPTAAKTWNVTLLFWALLFAYAGFPRERDEQTLTFLFSLPIPRHALFIAKFAAAGTLLSGGVLLLELSRWLIQFANPTSFGRATFRPSWALASLGLGVLTAWIQLGYATFLAVFRRLGLLLGLVAWTLLELLAKQRPALRQVCPLELMHVEFYYGATVLPYKALLCHALASVGLSALSAFIWVGPTERLSNAFSGITHKLWIKWLVALGILSMAVALGMVWSSGAERDEGASFGSLQASSGVESTLETRRYHFRFHEPLRARVARLATGADALHDLLSARLGAPTDAEQVLVNLLKPSGAHAGSATWNAIRMDLNSAYDDDTLRRTLIHETSHVIALRASDRRSETFAASVRFFDEGLAEHFALELSPDPARTRAYWLGAALLRTREHVEFAQLADFRALVAQFGEPAVYPLGFTWADVLLSTCGEDAARRIFAALRQPELPPDSSGERLVHAALQLARCDLSQVESNWGRRLDDLAKERKGSIARIPTLVGNIQTGADGEPLVRAELEGKPLDGAVYRLNVRSRPDDAIENQGRSSARLKADGHLEFWIPGGYVTNGALDFQFTVAWLEEGVYLEHAQQWRHGRVSE